MSHGTRGAVAGPQGDDPGPWPGRTEDMDVLRAGSSLVLGDVNAGNSGHVRHGPGPGRPIKRRPGDGPLVSWTASSAHGYQKQGAGYGYSRVYGYHPLAGPRLRCCISVTAAPPTPSAAWSVLSMSCTRRARWAPADSGFENHRLMRNARGVEFSIRSSSPRRSADL